MSITIRRPRTVQQLTAILERHFVSRKSGMIDNDFDAFKTSNPHLFNTILKAMVETDQVAALAIKNFVIYNDPKDFPGKYVMRVFYLANGILSATLEHYVADSYTEVIKTVPAGLTQVLRDHLDDHCIVETWM